MNEKNEKSKVCLNCDSKGYLIVDIDSITLKQIIVCPICKRKKEDELTKINENSKKQNNETN